MSDLKKKFYRSNVEFFSLLAKIKLWPSRAGILHGIRGIKIKGDYAEITTHCGHNFIIKNSKSSRAARWLRNKWVSNTCKKCRVPTWKIEKYTNTFFSGHYGSGLKNTQSDIDNDQNSGIS